MRSSDQTDAIAKALAAAQAEIEPPSATEEAQAGTRRYKYAPLSSVIAAAREPLKKNGLSVLQEASEAIDGVNITTRLQHESGQWIEAGPLFLPVGSTDEEGRFHPGSPQAYGSAITYGRRYAYSALLGIAAEEDDDGQTAKAETKEAAPPKRGSSTKAKPKPAGASGRSRPKADEEDSGEPAPPSADPSPDAPAQSPASESDGPEQRGPRDEIVRLAGELGWSSSKTLSFARNTAGLKVTKADWSLLSEEDAETLMTQLQRELERRIRRKVFRKRLARPFRRLATIIEGERCNVGSIRVTSPGAPFGWCRRFSGHRGKHRSRDGERF